uniref:Uncharacterized protein n=1 Tax=Anguilla anguilla TaxID=7936 RepID=A0A0E9T306_ANGAN
MVVSVAPTNSDVAYSRSIYKINARRCGWLIHHREQEA